MNVGPQSKSDNKMTAKYRLLQSRYRAEVLKEEFGPGPHKNSKKYYGNMLVNGEESGSNFISPAAFEFAKEKVRQKKNNKALTIDEFRLFNNMLSSMPMCFNLFSDLRRMLNDEKSVLLAGHSHCDGWTPDDEKSVLTPCDEKTVCLSGKASGGEGTPSGDAASGIARALFKEIPWIERLVEVDVEFIPVPIEEYTNDKSAFDAMLIVEDRDGRRGLISIETKYTDILGGNPSRDSETKNALVEQGCFFDEALKAELRTTGYKQIHRNFLLTYAYAMKQGFDNFVNIIISPAEDQLSVFEIEDLQEHMTKYRDRIFKIPLEVVVERGCGGGNEAFAAVMSRFNERYIG